MSNHPTFRIWPARYKASQIEIREADNHHNWIASAEIRKLLPALRTDAQLQKAHATGFQKLDKGPRLFFNESALTSELQHMGGHDALMLLAWLDKTVIYPAARKREGLPALKPTPPEAEEASGFIRTQLVAPLHHIWRGDEELARTVFAGGLTMMAWTVAVWLMVSITDESTYTGAYPLRQWLVLLRVLGFATGPVWWCTGIMRCALRRQHEGRSFAVSMAAFVGWLATITLAGVLPG